MNDAKRTQMPSLYDDLTPQTVLKILHKNKNDYVSRKTVWAVATLSFCVGGLAALLVFWMFFHSSQTAPNQSPEMDGTALSNQALPSTDKNLPVGNPINSNGSSFSAKSSPAQTSQPVQLATQHSAAGSPVNPNASHAVTLGKKADSHLQSSEAKNAALSTADKAENDNIANDSAAASNNLAREQSIPRESSGDKSPIASNPFKSLESDSVEPVKTKSKASTAKSAKTKSNTSAEKSSKAKSNTSKAKHATTKSTSAVKNAQDQNKASLKKIPDKKSSQPDQIEQLIMQINKANDKKNTVQKIVPSAHIKNGNSKSSKPS